MNLRFLNEVLTFPEKESDLGESVGREAENAMEIQRTKSRSNVFMLKFVL